MVHFSHGQQLTPEQLNSLGEFTIHRNAMLSQFLLGKEGIIDHYAQGLKLSLDKNDPMSLCVSPGAAINFMGQTVVLEEPELVSLRDLVVEENTQFFVQIQPVEALEEPWVDPELQEVQGYQIRRFGARVLVSKQKDPQSIELARIALDPTVDRVELLPADELLKSLKAPKGFLDERYANRILFYTNQLLSFSDYFLVQKTLKDFRGTLVHLKAAFQGLSLVDAVIHQVIFIQAETVERIFPVKKLGFLLGELKGSVLDLFEVLRDQEKNRIGASDQVWANLFESIDQIQSPLKGASLNQFKTISTLNQLIREHVLKTNSVQEKRVLIKESLIDLRKTSFGHFKKHAFGGVLYRLKNEIKPEHFEDKSSSQTDFQTQKALSAQFGDGESFKGRGYFYSEGKVTFQIEQLEAKQDTIVMLQIYKRRGVKNFSMIFNGEIVQQEKLASSDAIDQILNLGVLVPGESVKPGTNELTIDIQKVDLDFGLFGVWVYQEAGGLE